MQGCKALVYDAHSGKVVSRGAKTYDIIQSNVPGRAEQHPSLWLEVCRTPPFAALSASRALENNLFGQGGLEAMNSALKGVARKEVKGIGISGQQHGFVPVDDKGDVCMATSEQRHVNC